MNVMFCKKCDKLFTDGTPGDPSDDLHDHISSEHQDEYTELLETHFIGREDELPAELISEVAG